MWELDINSEGVVTDALPLGENYDCPNNLQVIDVEQNTDEWHQARMGIPTASAFDKVISKGRSDKPSAIRRKYMLQLLGERLTGVPTENFDTPQFQRGHHDEDIAANDYAFRQAVEVETAGFMRRGDMGYSPDRIIAGTSGAIEIKSKKPDLQLALMFDDVLPEEHKPQVQGGMLVGGFDFVDFVSYCKDLPLFVKRVYRDEKYISWLHEQIQQFNQELAEMERYVLRKYYGHTDTQPNIPF